MIDIFTFDTIERLLLDEIVGSSEFKEMCQLLDDYEEYQLMEMILTETVHDPKSTAGKVKGQIAKNTVDTTRTVAGLYNDTTTAGGKLYKSVFDLMMSGVKLITKIIIWMIDKGIKIPQTITKVTNRVSAIPSDIKVKIRGDIKLYITANDVAVINESVVNRIDEFIADLRLLMKGDMWTSFFHRKRYVKSSPRKDNVDGSVERNIPEIIFGKNDMQICRRMDATFKKIKIITFEQATINMSDKRNVELYFGTEILLTIRVYNRETKTFKEVKQSYYQAIRSLALTLEDYTNTLKELKEDLNNKFGDSKFEDEWAKISANQRSRIQKTINDVTKTVALLGNIQRYILIDMKTISDSVMKIMGSGKSDGVNVDNDIVKDGTDSSRKIKIPNEQKLG